MKLSVPYSASLVGYDYFETRLPTLARQILNTDVKYWLKIEETKINPFAGVRAVLFSIRLQL